MKSLNKISLKHKDNYSFDRRLKIYNDTLNKLIAVTVKCKISKAIIIFWTETEVIQCVL